MQNLNISKDMISNLAEQENKKFIRNTNKLVNNIVGSALKDLSDKVSFLTLNKVVLQPANELISGERIERHFLKNAKKRRKKIKRRMSI